MDKRSTVSRVSSGAKQESSMSPCRKTSLSACWILTATLTLAAQQSGSAASSHQMPSKSQTVEVSAGKFRAAVAEKLAASKGRAGAKIKNPAAGEKGIRPSVVMVLQQQKLASTSAHIQAVGSANAQSSSEPAGNHGGMLAPVTPGLLSQPQPASPGSRAPAPMNVRPPNGPTNLGPGQTLKATGNNATRPTTALTGITQPPGPSRTAPAPLTTMCLGPGIRAVNGQPKGALFTPIQDYNAYTITGCSFGNQPGQAYLIGKFRAQQINLQIQYWTDSEIDARVDPKISGELDQDNVSLVIAPPGAAPLKASGVKFMAARSDPAVLLSSIPSSWAKLQPVSVVVPHQLSPETVEVTYTSPANVPQASGDSAFVSRYLEQKFPPGSDNYDFSKLASGWTTDSMQLLTFDDDSCPWVVTYKQTFSNPFAEWVGDNIRVFWSDTTCSGFFPDPLAQLNYSNRTGSYYALNVWARGPRCTDPYNGKQQQQCIQNVLSCGNETCGN